MKNVLMIFLVSCIGFIFAYTWQDKASIDLKSTIKNQDEKFLEISPGYGNIPLYFIPNKGQANEKVLFYARTPGYTLWITKKGLVCDSIKRSTLQSESSEEKRGGDIKFDLEGGPPEPPPHLNASTHQLTNSSTRDVSHLMFIGANPGPEIVPLGITRHKVNYFIGKDKSKWVQDIPTSKAILYKDIYKSIDLKVYGIEKQIEYDWIIKPGGNPDRIRFSYQNVKSTHIDKKGNLVIKTEVGELIHKKPVSYQKVKARRQTGKKTGREEDNKAKREKLEVGFKMFAENTYGFAVGKYDKTRDFIIDPVVQLGYSTYLGGERLDYGYAIAVNSSGNAFITGITESKLFPTKNSFQDNLKGDLDVFITKLSPDGSRLEYSTYIGGSDGDIGYGIALDNQGCVYITGWTSSKDFPTENPFQERYGGGSGMWHRYDAFIAKLSLAGNKLLYSTYLGGNEPDYAYDIAVDSNNYAYVTGKTMSENFPTKNPIQSTYNGAYGMFDRYDAFVTKFSPEGDTLIYSTFLGGSVGDGAQGIAIDSNECVYITGFTMSENFPTQKPFQGNLKGYCDAFVTKFSSDGRTLLYSTYLGGNSSDGARYTTYHNGDIAVDQTGSAYVTSWTTSTNFPTRNPYQAEHNGGGVYGVDSFVSKLSPGGNSLEYSTFLGGNKDDYSSSIALDSSGNAYITGWTNSNNFPIKNPLQGQRKGRNNDVFVTKLSPDGSSLLYSTYIGGYETERCYGITVDNTGDAYATGYTASQSFPIKNSFQGSFHGWIDAFVTKLVDDLPPTVSIISPDNKAVVCGIAAIRAEADDDVGVDRVDFYIDSKLHYSDKQAPYEYDWESFRVTNGNHKIKAEAVDTKGHKTADEINVTTRNVILTLCVERKIEQAWVIRREYANIDLHVNNPGNLEVGKYIIYRKESNGEYQSRKEIPGAEILGGSYSFNDTYLEKDKTYYYKAEALDSSGNIIGSSDEQR